MLLKASKIVFALSMIVSVVALTPVVTQAQTVKTTKHMCGAYGKANHCKSRYRPGMGCICLGQ